MYQSTASDVKAQSAMYQFTVAQIHSSDVKAQLAMSKHNLRCPNTFSNVSLLLLSSLNHSYCGDDVVVMILLL